MFGVSDIISTATSEFTAASIKSLKLALATAVELPSSARGTADAVAAADVAADDVADDAVAFPLATAAELPSSDRGTADAVAAADVAADGVAFLFSSIT